MIVISGALVLVALILLVIGLVSASLTFVYASIGVSVLSFIALLLGVLQRRKDDQGLAVQDAAGSAPEEVEVDETAVAPVRRTASAPASAGTVLVVAGRPRYHVEGCRYLAGRSADPVDVARALEEGFTACGVCKPDEALAGASVAAAPASAAAVADPDQDAALEAPAETTAPPAPRTSPGKAAKKATGSKVALAKAPAPAKAPAKAAATKAAPAKAAPAKAPAKAATKASSASAPKRGGVIVIPDRGKFHTADCRYVRGASGTLELTRAQAVKQGYQPCGVCSS